MHTVFSRTRKRDRRGQRQLRNVRYASQGCHHYGHNETRHRQAARTTRDQVEDHGQAEIQDSRPVGHCDSHWAPPKKDVRWIVGVLPIQEGQHQLKGQVHHQRRTCKRQRFVGRR